VVARKTRESESKRHQSPDGDRTLRLVLIVYRILFEYNTWRVEKLPMEATKSPERRG